MADFEGATIDDIYDAFAYAETGSSKHRFQPWIRTSASRTEGGSNAYGPVQMLSKMVTDSQKAVYEDSGKPMIKFSDEETAFIERFKEQGNKMYEFGNEPTKEGYDSRYDYGGSGDLSKEDRKLYESTAKKIMAYELKRTGGIYNLKRSWRFGPKGGQDDEYFKKFDKKLQNILDDRDKASLFPDDKVMESVLG